jgi:DNA-binding response OmpR family regulator
MARQTRILVVEDEVDIAELIKHSLERNGAARVDVVATGAAALESVRETLPDLMILGLNLPVIMLTARTGETDRVSGLDLGADDYVTKPFSLRELAARVRAVLRRKSGGGSRGKRTDRNGGRTRLSIRRITRAHAFAAPGASRSAWNSSSNTCIARSTRCQSVQVDVRTT